MDVSLLKFAIIFVQYTLAYSNISRCVPNATDKVDCNRCWCVLDGVSVCTKMICSDIPRKRWTELKLEKNVTSVSAIDRLMDIMRRQQLEIVNRIRENRLKRFFADFEVLKTRAQRKSNYQSNVALQNFFSSVDRLKSTHSTKHMSRADLVMRGFFNNLNKIKSKHRLRSSSRKAAFGSSDENMTPSDWDDDKKFLKHLTGFKDDSDEIIPRVYEDLSVLTHPVDYPET